VNLPVLVVTGKDLTASERLHLKSRLAMLVSKREASLEYFGQTVARTLGASMELPVPARVGAE
jgi:hypothetical protein